MSRRLNSSFGANSFVRQLVQGPDGGFLKHGEMSPISPIEFERSSHIRCKLRATLRLLASVDITIPERAYPSCSPSPSSRLLQIGYSARSLFSAGRHRILVTGDQLAYLSGEANYFTDHVFLRSLGLLARRQPFFILSSLDPGRSISAATGCDAEPSPKLFLSSQCSVVIRAHWRGTPAVLHYGVCDAAVAEIERQVLGLKVAESHPTIRNLVPRFINHAVNGTAVSVQARLPGEVSDFSWRHINAAIALWLSCQARGTGRPAVLRAAEFVDRFPALRDQLGPIRETLLEWHERTRLPGNLAHGDFWLGNVLFESESVSGIVDWEWAQSEGLPAADALHMLLMSYAIAHDANVTDCLRQLWTDDITDMALLPRIDSLRVRVGLDKEDLKFIGLVLWFEYLHQRMVRGRTPHQAGTNGLLARTIPVITKWLKQYAVRSCVRVSRP